jgi:hypothetical protein
MLCLLQLKLLSQNVSFIVVDDERLRVTHRIDLIGLYARANNLSSILVLFSLVLDARGDIAVST